jgi:hypothetical protein
MEGEAGKPGKPDGSSGSEKKAPEKGVRAPTGSGQADGNRRLLRIGVVALALIAGLVAWIAVKGDDEETTPAASSGVEAKIVSASELEELTASSGHAVYWAGEIPGKEIEASESPEGNFQIRYLEQGTAAGEGSSAVLTIGSYPMSDPAAALEGFVERNGSLTRESDDGREVAVSAEKPTSVYFTGADGDVQVEVYDPDYQRAMRLALSDQVQPVS